MCLGSQHLDEVPLLKTSWQWLASKAGGMLIIRYWQYKILMYGTFISPTIHEENNSDIRKYYLLQHEYEHNQELMPLHSGHKCAITPNRCRGV